MYPFYWKVILAVSRFFAGPQISYLASANLKTTAGVLGINLLNKTMDATSQFNRWDAGVTGGIGYQFSNGLNISASYDYGLSKVDASRRVNAYNNAIKLGIGINFWKTEKIPAYCWGFYCYKDLEPLNFLLFPFLQKKIFLKTVQKRRNRLRMLLLIYLFKFDMQFHFLTPTNEVAYTKF